MAQDTVFGGAEVCTYMEVRKKDGTVRYYKVCNEETVEIDEATYLVEMEG